MGLILRELCPYSCRDDLPAEPLCPAFPQNASAGVAMNRLRSRLINIRVTDEELERLKAAAALHGSRCLSEFARFVMLGTATDQTGPASESLDSKLFVIDRRLAVLESNVARLIGKPAATNGSGTR
jgi:hypothetical protein